MDYNARYYSPRLGRFVSPDSIIPTVGDPQARDRYAYTYNNPLKYTDPSGHCVWDACLVEATAVAVAGTAVMVWYYQQTQSPEFRQAVREVGEQLGTMLVPPPVPASQPEPFPWSPPPDPLYIPGPVLETPEWQPILPGPPLEEPQPTTRALDFPLDAAPSLPTVLQATHKHHMVPKEILRDYLPPDVASHPDVRGKKGAPNRWAIPKDVHIDIHRGPGGGPYNQRWIEEINAIRTYGREVQVEDVMRIRDKLTHEFGLERYRP